MYVNVFGKRENKNYMYMYNDWIKEWRAREMRGTNRVPDVYLHFSIFVNQDPVC